jgi:hypothetical protein
MMADHPCNCSTCHYLIPFTPEDNSGLHQCSHPLIESNDNLTKYIGLDEYLRTFVLGCASHPLALQVLAKPVIEELEKTIRTNSKWSNLEPYYMGVNAMCEATIKLLKGEK